jgi:hypothetical protein
MHEAQRQRNLFWRKNSETRSRQRYRGALDSTARKTCRTEMSRTHTELIGATARSAPSQKRKRATHLGSRTPAGRAFQNHGGSRNIIGLLTLN